MSTNEGWYFEGPDPEVGIFGDSAVHEDCPKWDTENDVPAEVKWDESLRTSDCGKLVNITTTITCECGEKAVLTSQEPKEWFE